MGEVAIAQLAVHGLRTIIKVVQTVVGAETAIRESLDVLTTQETLLLNRVHLVFPDVDVTDSSGSTDTTASNETFSDASSDALGEVVPLIDDIEVLFTEHEGAFADLFGTALDVRSLLFGKHSGEIEWKPTRIETSLLKGKHGTDDASFRRAYILWGTFKLTHFMRHQLAKYALPDKTAKATSGLSFLRRIARTKISVGLGAMVESLKVALVEWNTDMNHYAVDSTLAMLTSHVRATASAAPLYIAMTNPAHSQDTHDAVFHEFVESVISSRFASSAGPRRGRSVTVIHGMGGMGKSTVTNLMVSRIAKTRAVVVVSGVSESYFSSDIREVAKGLGLPNGESLYHFIHKVWDKLSAMRALIVIDGLDVLTENLPDWLPRDDHSVDVLVTTRLNCSEPSVRARVKRHLFRVDGENPQKFGSFDIPPLNPAQSLDLAFFFLRDMVTPLERTPDFEEKLLPLIAEFAGGVPLSIRLLTAMIRNEYLARERKDESRFATLERVRKVMISTGAGGRELVMLRTVKRELLREMSAREWSGLSWIRDAKEELAEFAARLMGDVVNVDKLHPGSDLWKSRTSSSSSSSSVQRFCDWLSKDECLPAHDAARQSFVRLLQEVFRRSSLRLSIQAALSQLSGPCVELLSVSSPLDWSGHGVAPQLLSRVYESVDSRRVDATSDVDAKVGEALKWSLVHKSVDSRRGVVKFFQHPEVAQVIREVYEEKCLLASSGALGPVMPEALAIRVCTDYELLQNASHLESIAMSLARFMPVDGSSGVDVRGRNKPTSDALIRCLQRVDLIQQLSVKTLVGLAHDYIRWEPSMSREDYLGVVINVLYIASSTPHDAREWSTISVQVLTLLRGVLMTHERSRKRVLNLYDVVEPIFVDQADPGYVASVGRTLEHVRHDATHEAIRASPIVAFCATWLFHTLCMREERVRPEKHREYASAVLEYSEGVDCPWPTHLMQMQLDALTALGRSDDRTNLYRKMDALYRDRHAPEEDLDNWKFVMEHIADESADRDPIISWRLLLGRILSSSRISNDSVWWAYLNLIGVLVNSGTTEHIGEAKTLMKELTERISKGPEHLCPTLAGEYRFLQDRLSLHI